MASVELSIDEESSGFILSGDTNSIGKHYRAKYFFLDVLKAVFEADGTIVVPYRKEEKERILKQIQGSLQKYGIQQTDSDLIKVILKQYYSDKEKFAEFSKNARNIWNNRVDEREFREFKDLVEKQLPHRRLYDKQLLASFHLAFSQNACNFSVPGAGKTSIVYGAFAYLKSLPLEDPKKVNKLLVIGPLSSFGPWENEFRECFGRAPYSIRLSGGMPKEERDKHLLSLHPVEETPELTLMSYQSVSYNLKSLLYFLKRPDNKVMVVLDEAHRIKNVEGGVTAQAVLSIAKYCNSRVVLTGTPAPNGYEDIYNLFEFIWPEKDIIPFTTYQLKDISSTPHDPRVDELVESISPFFVRIKKSHLDLPPAVNLAPIYVGMGPIQREIYEFIENKYLSYFVENEKTLALTSVLAKARFIRLMQAATNPNLLRQPLEGFFQEQGLGDELYIDDTEIIKKIFRYKRMEVPQKFVVVRNLIRDLLAKDEKVVVWGTFIENAKQLQEYLAVNGIESRLLIGEVPIERDDVPMENILTREKIINEFNQKNSSFKVIIANPFAVSESISLHKACHNAIYLERTFNATHFIQSKDRIHRVGLDKKIITYYHFVLASNSIDETIHNRLVEKELRMLALIESQEIPLFSENMDYEIDLENDIKAIIRDYVRRTSQI
ncbi:MAG: DEAD/DEAH box helicase [Anaerolineae bacterium]